MNTILFRSFFSFFLFFLFIGQLQSQIYGTSIGAGLYGNCPTIDDECGPETIIANTVRLGVVTVSEGNIRFKLKKCDNSNFNYASTLWIKEDGICNPQAGSYSIPQGVSEFDDIYYSPAFTSGQKDIYIMLLSGPSYYYAGPITVYAPPATPVISNVYTQPTNSFNVTWGSVSGADGYNISRANCANCSYSFQNSVSAGTTNYVDNSVSCGVSYCYKVTAFKNNGAISDESNIDCGEPLEPAGLSPGTTSSSGVQISELDPYLDWNDFPGVTSYAVVIRDYISQNIVDDAIVSSSSYQVPSGVLQNGRTYKWFVIANCGGDDVQSNPRYFVTPPATPPNLQFASCISLTPHTISMGSEIDFSCVIENFGGSNWEGNLKVTVEEDGNASNNEEIYINTNITISPQEEYPIDRIHTLGLAEGVYSVYVEFKTDGNGFYEFVRNDISGCVPNNTSTHYEELSIQSNVPGSLEFSSCINAADEVEIDQVISGQVTLRNPGTQNWTGQLDVFAKKSNDPTVYILYTDASLTVTNGNSTTINFSDDGSVNDIITEETGTYYIYVSYTNAPDGYGASSFDYVAKGDCAGESYTFGETGTLSHRHELLVVPVGQGGASCNITVPDPDSPQEQEAWTAANFLCQQGIIDDPTNGNVDPYANITRAQLAKILYYGLFGAGAAPTVASNFPTPFLDLIEPSVYYYDAAKALSYLQYDDMKTPFDREFANFNPDNHIKRGHLLKALLETFNVQPVSTSVSVAGVDPDHEMSAYVNAACNLDIISCSNPSYNFRPDDLAQRYEAFILLWRYLDQCGSCTKPVPQSDDFFYPVNITPENMGKGMGFADGNFKHYTRTSFSIPGKKIPLVFEHLYNSYAVDLPDQIYEDYGRPLGVGWSHSYHCYIQKFEDHRPDSSKLVVFWPGNSLNVYYQNNLEAITKNIYDAVTDNGNTITIKKKNQVVFTFERLSSGSDIWLLKTITDRNQNTVELFYENYSGAKKRLKRVRGTAGRELEFFYDISGKPAYISRVKDPLRNVYFTYDGDDLKTYQDPMSKNTTYYYGETEDLEHLLLSIRLPKGNTITNTYESRKLQSTSTNNQTVTASWSWDNANLRVNNTVNVPTTNGSLDMEYQQNSQGYTEQLNVKNGDTNLHTVDIQYNDPDNPYLPTYVNTNGDVINYTYDDRGNVTQMALPLGITHQFAYTLLNDVDYYMGPRNNITDFAYDGNGNLKSITDPLQHITRLDYYPDGLIKKVTNAEGIAVNYAYDNYGNLENISAPEGIQIGMSYDVIGRMERYTDPNGNISRTIYRPDDLVDKIIDQDQKISDYNYDLNNNLTEIVNRNGKSTILEYDFDNDWLKSQSFGGNTDAFDYYPDGRLQTHTDPNSHTDTYIYDAQGRLVDDGYATYEYYPSPDNELQYVRRKDDPNKEIAFTYDILNRVETITDYYGNIVTYDYDDNSNLERIHYPGSKQVTYIYDAANRLTTVRDWNNNSTVYTYYDDNRLQRIDFPNGTFTRYYYDTAGRMTGMGNYKSDSDIINEYTYVLDPLGNHLQLTQQEPYGNFNWTASTVTPTYDDHNHLETFGDRTYGDNNNGNITSVSGAASYTFGWDTEDQLTSISGDFTSSYEYDGLGHRRQAVRNGSTTRYVLDILGMSKVLMETDGSNNPIYYYIHGLGQIARVDAAGNYHYYHYDYRGSTIAMTDNNKNITHQYQYGPYGKVLQSQEADFNAYRYVGGFGVQYENEDIYFMRARYYDVSSKRFISEDAVWGENLYWYADGNPVRNSDPSGNIPYSQEFISNNIKDFIIEDNSELESIPYINPDFVVKGNINFNSNEKETNIGFGGGFGNLTIPIRIKDYSMAVVNEETNSYEFINSDVAVKLGWSKKSFGFNYKTTKHGGGFSIPILPVSLEVNYFEPATNFSEPIKHPMVDVNRSFRGMFNIKERVKWLGTGFKEIYDFLKSGLDATYRCKGVCP